MLYSEKTMLYSDIPNTVFRYSEYSMVFSFSYHTFFLHLCNVPMAKSVGVALINWQNPGNDTIRYEA